MARNTLPVLNPADVLAKGHAAEALAYGLSEAANTGPTLQDPVSAALIWAMAFAIKNHWEVKYIHWTEAVQYHLGWTTEQLWQTLQKESATITPMESAQKFGEFQMRLMREAATKQWA